MQFEASIGAEKLGTKTAVEAAKHMPKLRQVKFRECDVPNAILFALSENCHDMDHAGVFWCRRVPLTVRRTEETLETNKA